MSMNTDALPGLGASRWLIALTAIASALTGWALWKEHAERGPRGGLPPGRPAPAIEAAGWLNVSEPDDIDFSGDVVLLQGWFTTCPQCHAETPELVELYKQYHSRGVEFVSLTFEDEGRFDAIQSFVHEKGIQWPVGYGARATLRAFEAAEYPCLWLIDRNGAIVWNHDSSSSLRSALESVVHDS